MLAVVNGVLSERDYLLGYTMGEYYNEMSLFIEIQEIKKKQIEEMKRKK